MFVCTDISSVKCLFSRRSNLEIQHVFHFNKKCAFLITTLFVLFEVEIFSLQLKSSSSLFRCVSNQYSSIIIIIDIPPFPFFQRCNSLIYSPPTLQYHYHCHVNCAVHCCTVDRFCNIFVFSSFFNGTLL